MPDQPPQTAPPSDYDRDSAPSTPPRSPTMTDLTDEPFDLDWLQEQVDDISTIRSPLDRQFAAEGLVLSGEIDDLLTEVRRLRATIAAVDAIERWPYNPGTMQGFELDQAQGYNDALAEVHRALHPEADQ